VARKSPLSKLQESVVGTVKGAISHPVESAEKAVEQAKGRLSLGKMVAGQVTKTAAGAVTSRLGHRGGTPSAPVRPSDEPLRAVPDTPSAPAAAAKPAPAKPAPAKSTPAKSTPAKTAAKKSTPTPTKAPVTDVATELVKEQAAHQPTPEPSTEPTTSIDAAADPSHVEATPADVAKKATSRKPAVKTATPAAKKAPAKKATAKKTTAKKAASSPSAKLPVRKPAPADADES
jgi:hypothetical protein